MAARCPRHIVRIQALADCFVAALLAMTGFCKGSLGIQQTACTASNALPYIKEGLQKFRQCHTGESRYPDSR